MKFRKQKQPTAVFQIVCKNCKNDDHKRCKATKANNFRSSRNEECICAERGHGYY